MSATETGEAGIQHRRSGAVALENRALYWAAIGLVVGVVASLVFAGQYVPLSGRGSVGALAAVVAAGFTAVTFVVSFLRARKRQGRVWASGRRRFRQIVDLAGLLLLHVSLAFFFSLITFAILQDAFKGLTVDGFTTATMVGIVGAVCGYFTYLGASNVTSFSLSALLAAFLLAGGLISMITAEDPLWWTNNFSALGMGDAFSSWTFNFTMIVAGLVIVTLADFVTADLRRWDGARNGRINTLTGLLVALGILLAGVGLVPVDTILIVHNSTATGMVIVFFVIVVGLRRMLPGISAAFVTLSYGLLAGIVLSVLLFFPIGYNNLTATELICAALIFTWLVIFVRIIAAAAVDRED